MTRLKRTRKQITIIHRNTNHKIPIIMKKALLLIATCCLTAASYAQGVLQVEDLSRPNDVYTSANDQAAVRIRCHHDIPLSFSSSMDKSADPFSTNIEGSDSLYYIEFPTGSRYRGRILTITAPGYNPVEIPLELEPKQLATFKITDPNSLVDAGCYRKHRNQGMLELKNMNYSEARNQFELAAECSDVDQAENQQNINLTDSLIKLRRDADQAFELLNYSEATVLYNKIVSLNAYDSYAAEQAIESNNRFSSECNVTFKQAESYFDDREYDKAKELYQKIIDRGCYASSMATDRISTINRYQTAKSSHATVLTYEWIDGAPIGFHIGRYNMHKVGGYFHMNVSGKIFDAMRSECVMGDTPEAMIGFGWTLKVANPVWVHFGPGVGAKLYYGEYKEDMYPDKDGMPKTREDLVSPESTEQDKVNAAMSINPEIGITVKYSYFALRLTYQYRFAMKKDLEDLLGKNFLMLGIGFAF